LHRGRNAPGEVAAISRVFAELRGETPEAIRLATGANVRRVLPRLDPQA
jgi:Tat protein secretion system quality control protein TatD with DNase activity